MKDEREIKKLWKFATPATKIFGSRVKKEDYLTKDFDFIKTKGVKKSNSKISWFW